MRIKPNDTVRKTPARSRAKGVRTAAALRRARGAAEVRLAPLSPEKAGPRRLPIAVVVAELRGLRHPPSAGRGESSVQLVRELSSTFADVAVERGAGIDATSGGVFRFLYGVDQPRRDDPAQALLLALAVQRAFLGLRNQWLREGRGAGAALRLGFGVASGQVLARQNGETVSTLSGRPLERAARLGEAARPLEVLVDDQTMASIGRVLDDQIEFTPRRVRSRNSRPSIAYRAQAKRGYLRLVRPARSAPASLSK